MSTDPLHHLANVTVGRWAGLHPLGLDPSGLRVDGATYWEIKVAWLTGQRLSRDQLVFVGALDPYPPDRSWPTNRGWRSADLRTVSRRDEEREVAARGVRWLVDLGGDMQELSV